MIKGNNKKNDSFDYQKEFELHKQTETTKSNTAFKFMVVDC